MGRLTGLVTVAARPPRPATAVALLGVAVLLTACAPEPDAAEACEVPAIEGTQLADCDEIAEGTADLPDLALPCLVGGRGRSLDAIGGPAVLNFWGSWCGPCRKEMPVIDDFHEQYGDQVAVVGVAIDTYPEAAADFAVQREVSYPSLLDACGSIEDTSLVMKALPQFVFVAEDGSVQQVAGGVESVDELVDLVEEHLGLELEPAR